MPVGWIYAVLIITLAAVLAVARAPGITITRGGKVLAFLALFIFPILAGSLGYEEHMERSKETSFCLSCHVMEPYGRSLHVDDSTWLPAAHYQNNRVPRENACYTCHTDYVMYGTLRSKFRGLRHIAVQYFGTIPDTIKLYTPYNNRECLHCHGGARKFLKVGAHRGEANFFADVTAATT